MRTLAQKPSKFASSLRNVTPVKRRAIWNCVYAYSVVVEPLADLAPRRSAHAV